jgi:hypothetical protein
MSVTVELTKIKGELVADAKEALAFLTKEAVKIAQGGPRAIAALGVLLGAVKQFIADGEAANLIAAIADIKQAWADLEIFAADLGIKL